MRPPESVPSGWAYKGYATNIWSRYQLNYADWKKIWVEQEGCCAICRVILAHPVDRNSPPGAKCCVDHRHIRGETTWDGKKREVRGLLCVNCNIQLGVLREDPVFLREAASYLERKGISDFDYEEPPVKRKEPGLSERPSREELWEVYGIKDKWLRAPIIPE